MCLRSITGNRTQRSGATEMEDYRLVGVDLPQSVIDIIQAAGGTDTAIGMPKAMASIVGCLPWIAVALFQTLPPDKYQAFATQLKENMQLAWFIAGHENPEAAFDGAMSRARGHVN